MGFNLGEAAEVWRTSDFGAERRGGDEEQRGKLEAHADSTKPTVRSFVGNQDLSVKICISAAGSFG